MTLQTFYSKHTFISKLNSLLFNLISFQFLFFDTASDYLSIITSSGKFTKRPTKSTLFDDIIVQGLKQKFGKFSILLKEGNVFKLQLKDFLLISHDNPIFYRNIFSFPLIYCNLTYHYLTAVTLFAI